MNYEDSTSTFISTCSSNYGQNLSDEIGMCLHIVII